MASTISGGTFSAANTIIRFSYQTSTTSSSDIWDIPIFPWLEVQDSLYKAAKQRQRVAWLAHQKIRAMAPVPPFRRYQKMFQKHLFAPGRKK